MAGEPTIRPKLSTNLPDGGVDGGTFEDLDDVVVFSGAGGKNADAGAADAGVMDSGAQQIFEDGFVEIHAEYKKESPKPFNPFAPGGPVNLLPNYEELQKKTGVPFIPVYKSIDQLPICEINGIDKYFDVNIYGADLARVWEVPKGVTLTKQDEQGEDQEYATTSPYVFFLPANETKEDAIQFSGLTQVGNLRDDTFVPLLAKHNNFIHREPEIQMANGKPTFNIKESVYPLCRSAARDTDGFFHVWSYKTNKFLHTPQAPLLGYRMATVEKELTTYQMMQVIVEGGLTPSQFGLEEWKLFVSANPLSIDNHIKKIEASGMSAQQKAELIAALKNAVEWDDEMRGKSDRAEARAEKADLRADEGLRISKKGQMWVAFSVILIALLFVPQVLLLLQSWGIDVRKFFKKYSIEDFGQNLTDMARRGDLTPIIGRFEELKLVVQQLLGDKKAMALLVGDAGAGKTAIPEKLAQLIALGDKAVELLTLEGVSEKEAQAFAKALRKLNKTNIGNVDVTDFISGTGIRGTLEVKVKAFLKVFGRDTDNLAFIDELHRLLGAGRTMGSTDSVDQALKPALARGELPLIGATTIEEYLKHFAEDAALRRRIGEPILVKAHTPLEVIEILKTLRDRGYYKKLFNLDLSDGAIGEAVRLVEGQEGSTIDLASELIKAAMKNKEWNSEGGTITETDIQEDLSMREQFSLGRYFKELHEKNSGTKPPRKPPSGGTPPADGSPPAAGASGGSGGSSPPAASGGDGNARAARVANAGDAEIEVPIIEEEAASEPTVEPEQTVWLPPTGGTNRSLLSNLPSMLAFPLMFVAEDVAEHKKWIPHETRFGIDMGMLAGTVYFGGRMAVAELAFMMPFFITGKDIAKYAVHETGIEQLQNGTIGNTIAGTLGGVTFAGVAGYMSRDGLQYLAQNGLQQTLAVGVQSTIEDFTNIAQQGRQMLQLAGSRFAEESGKASTAPILAAAAGLNGGVVSANAVLAGGEITTAGAVALGGAVVLAGAAGAGVGLGINELYKKARGKSLGEETADIQIGNKTLGDWWYEAFLK